MIKFLSSKNFILIFGIFSLFILFYLVLSIIFDIDKIIEVYIKSLPKNPVSAIIIFFLLTLDLVAPIPSSIVIITSGIIFGGFFGGIIALLGSLSGSILNFLLSRKLGKERVKKWIGKKDYEKLSIFLEKYGDSIILLTRMVPLVSETLSTVAGLSKIKFPRFVLLNIIGFFPLIFLYTYSGEIFKDKYQQNILIVLFFGFFIPLFLWLIFLRIKKI